jgi:hypothetical protein
MMPRRRGYEGKGISLCRRRRNGRRSSSAPSLLLPRRPSHAREPQPLLLTIPSLSLLVAHQVLPFTVRQLQDLPAQTGNLVSSSLAIALAVVRPVGARATVTSRLGGGGVGGAWTVGG